MKLLPRLACIAALLALLLCTPALAQPGTAQAVSTPTVTSVVPAMAPNDRDTAVVISGTGFATDLGGAFSPVVTLGTTPLVAVTFVDDTTLTGTVPQGMSPGVYDVTVINPDTGSATLTSALTVTLPPTVATIDPASAYNDIDTAVTIRAPSSRPMPPARSRPAPASRTRPRAASP